MAQNQDPCTLSGISSIIEDPGELYLPLDPNGTTIRLLHVMEDNVFRLETHDINKAPRYHALSYAWREVTDRPESKYISIQGRLKPVPVLIQYNLWSFLAHMPLFLGSDVYLWIDFLCINQRDVSEGNHQVGMMQGIYSSATQVLAWIGERLSGAPHKLLHGTSSCNLDLEKAKDREELLGDAPTSTTRRKYWSRLWAVQEFLLNPNLKICLGSVAIHYNEFMTAHCTLFQGYRSIQNHGVYTFSNASPGVAQLCRLRRDYQLDLQEQIGRSKSNMVLGDLRQLVARTSGHYCADTRDRIFALLGLCSSHDLTPD